MSLKGGIGDRFKGVTLSICGEVFAKEEFETLLISSLEQWRSEKKRGIWITVSSKQSDLIPVLTKHGFSFHHVNEEKTPEANTLTLTTWLEDSDNQLPHQPTHYCGVGGMVFSKDRKKVLVVSETYESGTRWKLPGGLVDKGENICESVVREVKEETGVDAKVVSHLLMRERTDALFGASDLYFVYVLEAVDEEICKDPKEIADCQWKSLEFLRETKDCYPMNKALFEIASLVSQSLKEGNVIEDVLLRVPNHLGNAEHIVTVNKKYLGILNKLNNKL